MTARMPTAAWIPLILLVPLPGPLAAQQPPGAAAPPNALRNGSEAAGQAPAAAAARSEAPLPPPVRPEAPAASSASQLQQQILAVEQSHQLDPAVQTEVLNQLRKALTWLQNIEPLAAQTSQRKAEIAAAPGMLAEAKNLLAQAPPEAAPQVAPAASLNELVKAQADVQKQLDEARTELTQREADLKLRDRKTELTKLADDASRQLEALRAAPPPAAEGEVPALAEARRAEHSARTAFLEAQLENFRTESARLDALSELFTLRRDLARRRVTRLEQLVAAWQSVVDAARQRESGRQAAEARRALENAHPALKSLAGLNTKLTEERTDLAAKIQRVAGEVETNGKSLASISERLATVREKVRVAGLSTTIGLLLRKQREQLPDGQALKEQLEFVQSQLPEVSLRMIELEEERARLADLDRYVETVIGSLDQEVFPFDARAVERLVRQSLASQQEYLDKLLADYLVYLQDLSNLEFSTLRLLDSVAEFQQFIDERILWIRSSDRLGIEHFREAGKALAVLGQPASWAASLGRVGDDIFNQPFSTLGILLGWVLLFLSRGVLRRMLYQLARPSVGSPFQSMGVTLQACAVTFTVAVLWPLLMWILAWRLSLVEPATELIASIATAVNTTAAVFFPLELVRQFFRPQGVAEAHLGWDPGFAQLVRSAVKRLMVVGLPLLSVDLLILSYQDELYRDSLGRLVAIGGLLLLAVVFHGFFHPVHGLIERLCAGDPQGWPYRLRRPIHLIAVGSPLALAAMAAVGYGYSAQQLGERFLVSVWFLLAVLLIRQLVARWFFLRQWAMARRRAEQRAAEGTMLAEGNAAEAGRGDPSLRSDLTEPAREAIREQEIQRLVHIDRQLQQLLRVGVALAILLGAFWIWRDMFPALYRLDRIVVWPAAGDAPGASPGGAISSSAAPGSGIPAGPGPATAPATVGAVVESPAAVDIPGRLVRPTPAAEEDLPPSGTSLADILLAVIIAAATILAGRNIPALLEVTLLERLPMEQGARVAATTIVGYAIMLLGIIVGANVIGLSWHNIQWLAAAITVGLGFGLQEIFANFVSGLILLFERPIRVGDIITLGDVTGTVTNIRIRATTITNWDRQELIVPNKDLVTGRLLNWTLTDTTNRIVINVGVAYGSDTRKTRDLLARIAGEHPAVLADPAPLVTLEGFGDSTLNFVLRCYLASLAERLQTIHDLHEAIHERFAAAGIEIAFPQRDVRFRTPIPWAAPAAVVETDPDRAS